MLIDDSQTNGPGIHLIWRSGAHLSNYWFLTLTHTLVQDPCPLQTSLIPDSFLMPLSIIPKVSSPCILLASVVSFSATWLCSVLCLVGWNLISLLIIPQVIIHNWLLGWRLFKWVLQPPRSYDSPTLWTDSWPPLIELADTRPPLSLYEDTMPLLPGTAPQTVINIGDSATCWTCSESPSPPPVWVRAMSPCQHAELEKHHHLQLSLHLTHLLLCLLLSMI